MKTYDAKSFMEALKALQSDDELRKIQRYFKSGDNDYGAGDVFMGVRMGEVFKLAKAMMSMPLKEVEKLLESEVHEARAGAVSIMDFRARVKKITAEERKALFTLYISRHDRINNWDLVDRSAQFVVGAYVYENPGNTTLEKLAKSKNIWERRTAMVSTAYFLRKGDNGPVFKIAEMLIDDKEDLIQKAVGGWLREAGRKSPEKLRHFLDMHAPKMAPVMLRYATEHFDQQEKQYYSEMRKAVKAK